MRRASPSPAPSPRLIAVAVLARALPDLVPLVYTMPCFTESGTHFNISEIETNRTISGLSRFN